MPFQNKEYRKTASLQYIVYTVYMYVCTCINVI